MGPASKSDTPDDDYNVTSHRILSKETIGEGNKDQQSHLQSKRLR